AGGQPKVFADIVEEVKKGSGLLMLAGYETLGTLSDWAKTAPELAEILPVDLSTGKDVAEEEKLKFAPTRSGEDHYLLNLADSKEKNKMLWSKFDPLEGMTQIEVSPEKKDLAVVLATREGTTEPLMVGLDIKKGRTLVFSGHNMYRCWRRFDENAQGDEMYQQIHVYDRFWKQMML